mgnify:CR=1 FL=1
MNGADLGVVDLDIQPGADAVALGCGHVIAPIVVLYAHHGVAAAQFDSLFAAAKIDPANAKLSAQQVVEKAHKAVLALNGLAEAPKPRAEAAAPAAPAPRNVPPSIGGLPNASQTVVQDELLAQFNQLEGDDAERFMASLNDKQVERLMRMSDGRGVH